MDAHRKKITKPITQKFKIIILQTLIQKKTKKDHHKPKKIIAADRPHPHFRHFMVEKYEIKHRAKVPLGLPTKVHLVEIT